MTGWQGDDGMTQTTAHTLKLFVYIKLYQLKLHVKSAFSCVMVSIIILVKKQKMAISFTFLDQNWWNFAKMFRKEKWSNIFGKVTKNFWQISQNIFESQFFKVKSQSLAVSGSQ